MAEVFRGGIEAVHPGQVEAAKSLGMGPALTLWRVVLPHAFKVALPLYGNTCIMLIKDTLRASIITVTELSFQSKVIAATRPGAASPSKAHRGPVEFTAPRAHAGFPAARDAPDVATACADGARRKPRGPLHANWPARP